LANRSAAHRILIDGRSGSGKTELAKRMALALPGSQLVRLDDIYPGWGGLEAGSRHVHDYVLSASGPRWQRWDWSDNTPAEWHVLDPSRPIIVEGCGALSRANRALADYGIWVELDEATRKARALARDGDAYAPHWDEWAAQEQAFIDRENPRALADQVVEG
jgi:uridine kinase